MLGTLEDNIEKQLNNTPFVARLFFGYEINALRTGLRKSKRLRNAYAPTGDWYIQYGKNLNNGFNLVFNAVDRTYAAYDAIKRIPIIGAPICGFIENYFGDAVTNILPKEFIQQTPKSKPKIPQRQTTLNALQSVYTLSIEGVCAHYEATTNMPGDKIREQISTPLIPYKNDPSPMRKAFVDALEGIGNFLGELFGGGNYRVNT